MDMGPGVYTKKRQHQMQFTPPPPPPHTHQISIYLSGTSSTVKRGQAGRIQGMHALHICFKLHVSNPNTYLECGYTHAQGMKIVRYKRIDSEIVQRNSECGL